jgi:hypothetical protein
LAIYEFEKYTNIYMIVAIGEVIISLLGVIVILQSRGGNKLLFDELGVLFWDEGDVDDAIERDVDDVDVDDAVDDDNEGICCCCVDSSSSSSPSVSRSSLEFLKGE